MSLFPMDIRQGGRCLSTQLARTEIASRTASVIEEMKALEGPLLPILHEIQHEFGHVPAETLPLIAEALNISNAEVHGVVSFYHDYRNHPAGRHVLKICRAEACQAMGADALAQRVQEMLGIGFHATAKDGSVTLEPVYCLGLCACAPAAMLDGEVMGRLDNEAIDEIVVAVRA